MPLPEPLGRSGHAAVSLGEVIMVWGGYTMHDDLFERYIDPSEVWAYHVETKLWRVIQMAGQCPPGTSGACAVTHQGRMYVTCGHTFDGNSSETFCLNWSSREWSHLDAGADHERPSPRDKFVAWVYNDRLYIFGGYGIPPAKFLNITGRFVVDESTNYPVRGWNNQLCALDLSSNCWEELKCSGNVPSPRAAHAVVKSNSRIFLFGGRHGDQRLNDLYVLDLTANFWTRLSPVGNLPVGRSWHSFTPFSERYFLLFGGYSQNSLPLSDSWVFDSETCSWRELQAQSNQTRLWHTACDTKDGVVVVFGGCINNILDRQVPNRHTNEVLVFRFSPNSLLNIALECVIQNLHLLANHLDEIPASLQEKIRFRSRVLKMKEKNSEDEKLRGERGLTCSIS